MQKSSIFLEHVIINNYNIMTHLLPSITPFHALNNFFLMLNVFTKNTQKYQDVDRKQ